MTQLVRRFVSHPILQVTLLATLFSVLFVAGCGLVTAHSTTAQRALAWLAPGPHLSHPLGQLRGNAPAPSSSAEAPLASAPSLD